jgi:hypothetical protein
LDVIRRRRREATTLPDVGFLARGWIERVTGTIDEGLFDAEQGIPGHTYWLMFSVGGQTDRIPWSDVNWVRLVPRSELGDPVSNAHAALLARSSDPNVVIGYLSGAMSGIPGADLFVLVPVMDRSAEQWIELFSDFGVEVRTGG